MSQLKNCLFIIIDGHSLAFRAYHAFAHAKKGPLRTSTGTPTSVCFGFLNSLIQVIESQTPQYLAIAFDRPEPSFRHQVYTKYKADRQPTPEDFIPDLANLQEILACSDLRVISAAGYEADDVIGTIARQARDAGCQVKIVTGDRDLFQLVDTNIKVLYLDRNAIRDAETGSYLEIDAVGVEAKLGVKPSQVVDYKALSGDKSDNIPGVTGIGEKTAIKLLKEYETLEMIYANLNQIQGAVQKKLTAGHQDALTSRHLAQLAFDVPLEFKLSAYQLPPFKLAKIRPLLEKLELTKVIQRLQKLTPPTSNPETQQLSLFDTWDTQPTVPTNNNSIIQPQIIATREQLQQLISQLATYQDPNQPVAWDTETTALDVKTAKLVGIGCCWGSAPTEIAYIPLNHTQGINLPLQETLNLLSPLLTNTIYPKVFQNTKFDRLILRNHGICLGGVVFDTLLASYVLQPETSHKLSDLCRRYLSGVVTEDYRDLSIAKHQTIADLEITRVANYCGLDAYATRALFFVLKQQLLTIPELAQILFDIEQPLEPVLAEMEFQGIRINTQCLKEFSQQLAIDLQKIEQQAYQAAGTGFNLASPKQLSEILFEQLGLNKKKTRKTKTGYSTDHATLEKLQGDHPVIDYILEHRTLSKLKSTYVDALPVLVNPQTKRIHTDFNQAVTATGRLSSSNPNLQNIPIRTEFSRQIRRAFIPEDGWLLVAADYSQIELRILAHLSQEPVLLEAYQNYQDVHRVTAQLLFEKTEITPQERNLGKTINFGVIYGMGAQRFQRESGFPLEDSKAFITKYHRQYPQIFAYLESMKKQAIAQGFVQTIKGRRRYFEFMSETMGNLRGADWTQIKLEQLKLNNVDAQLLRAAANAPIQGSSADIIKIAMVKLHQILQDYQARLLLQVHDELVFEIPPQEWDELKPKIKETMENAVTLTVPLVVEIRQGNNWMEAK